jgi:hypothetical protein
MICVDPETQTEYEITDDDDELIVTEEVEEEPEE